MKYICVIKIYTFEKIKYGIKYCENIRENITLRLQLLHVKSHVVSKFLWKSRSLFARNCRAKLSVQNKQDSSSFPIRFVEYRGSSIAIHAGTIYFYLGRKSPVVMEIYRGLNIDIGARQRRSEMSLNRNLESLCVYQKYAPKKYATIKNNHLSRNTLCASEMPSESISKNWSHHLFFLYQSFPLYFHGDLTRFIWFYYSVAYS